jgi:hypothetical protein
MRRWSTEPRFEGLAGEELSSSGRRAVKADFPYIIFHFSFFIYAYVEEREPPTCYRRWY